jgi:hypothetical protein
MGKTNLTTEKIESFLSCCRGFLHWEQNSLEDISVCEELSVNESGYDLHFSPSLPLEGGEVIIEKFRFVSEYLHAISVSTNVSLSEIPTSSNPYLEEKARSLLESYFEYQSLIDFLLQKLPLKLRTWPFEGSRSENFEVKVSNEKHHQGTLLYNLTSNSVMWPAHLYNELLLIKRCYFHGLDPFPPFNTKKSFYPDVGFLPCPEMSVIRYALANQNKISSFIIEIQCLSRLEGQDWSGAFSRIIFGLILSEGDIRRTCDLVADQLADPRNIKFLEALVSSWRNDSKTRHLPFKLIRTLCALAKRGGSSQLAAVVPAISDHVSVHLGALEKSMLLHAGNQNLFQELKVAALSYVLTRSHNNFSAEDQAMCFVLESLIYSNPKSGRQALADMLTYLDDKGGYSHLNYVVKGLLS